MATTTEALPRDPTMMDVGRGNETNLGSSRALLTRLQRIREHLIGARPANPDAGAVPTRGGLVEAFMEDARAQAMLNIECHDEARLIEGALALKHPDEAAGEATPALREALGGVATTGRRYA